MNVRQRRPEILHMMADSGCAALIFDSALADQLPDASELTTLRWSFAIDPSSAAGAQSFASLLEPAASTTFAPGGGDDPFCILYTSGTTGKPKGAILTQLGVVHSALHFEHGLRLKEGDVAALAVPASMSPVWWRS